MFIGQYILDDDGNPVPEPDSLKWAQWFETADRVVQQDQIGDVFVSTVFLGLDHGYHSKIHVLWETMIFSKGDGNLDHWMQRYTSKQDAIAGHMEAVELVKASQKDLQELERMAEAGGWTKK